LRGDRPNLFILINKQKGIILKKIGYLILFLCIYVGINYGQTNDYELGAMPQTQYRQQGGFFDYSDPRTINIKVAIWGSVRYPGRYVIPVNSSVNDLISMAGGPTTDSELDNLRLYRVMPDSTRELIKFNLDDVMWEKELISSKITSPNLQAGDILVVPTSPKYFFREWLSIGLSIFSALISLAILLTR
jgi:hypothetical protein